MMSETPETRYAQSGEVHIAYQVLGGGDVDLLFDPGIITHVEAMWEEPSFADFFHRLASFARLILFDRRGVGLSDALVAGQAPLLEQRVDDALAVLDAAGAERATIFGGDVGGRMALLLAAMYPERVNSLIVYGVRAIYRITEDHPNGFEEETYRALVEDVVNNWGTGVSLPLVAPSFAEDKRFKHWWAQFERLSISPGAVRTLLSLDWNDDIRTILSSVRVPTLVLTRSQDVLVPLSDARFITDRIPDARLIELPGVDHYPLIGEVDPLIAEVQHFLTGLRGEPEIDRVLTTVLFIDVVTSTEYAVSLGDRRWRELLTTFQRLTGRHVARFRGREIDWAGDGLLATFDGPARAAKCAASIREAARGLGLELRSGIHTGEVELMDDGIAGLAVHIGARIAAAAQPGEILASQTVHDLVSGSGITFHARGAHDLKGVQGNWQLYEVELL